MGGNLTTTGKVLKWRVELPPWSSRKADVGVIVPSIPERVEVQGKVTVYGHEEISVVTDDPRTNETGDPTLLTVSCEHGSQAEEREMNNGQTNMSPIESSKPETTPETTEGSCLSQMQGQINSTKAQPNEAVNSSIYPSLGGDRGEGVDRRPTLESPFGSLQRLAQLIIAIFAAALIFIAIEGSRRGNDRSGKIVRLREG